MPPAVSEVLARSPRLAAVPTRLLAVVWPAAIFLVVAEAVYQLSGADGYDTLFDDVFHDAVVFGAAVVGWRAIVLPISAQALAVGIQVYSLFHELGSAERIITLVVLLVAMVQIILARPRAAAG